MLDYTISYHFDVPINTYGHPTPEVLSRLAEREIPVLRNDLQGAIGMKLTDGKIVGMKQMLRDGN